MDTQSRFLRRLLVVVLAAGAVEGFLPSCAWAGWKEMAVWLPAGTNAIVALNVDALLRSPLGAKEGWADRWTDCYEAGPVAIIPGTQRMLAGAFVKQGLQDADWRITIMELAEPLQLEDVGRSQGGYPEKVWDKMCVCSPTAYFVSLDPKTLASYTPANRQSVFNWVCDKPVGVASANLRGIVSGLGGSTHIVMAMDVTEQYSASGIRSNVGMNPLSRIDPKTDLDRLAHALAGIQYVALSVKVTDKMQATTIVQVASDGEWLGKIAKSVVPEILDRGGISLPELDSWTVTAEARRITLAGEMSVDSMRDLLSITGLRTTTKPVKVSDDPAMIAKASRTFFRTICASLDSYPKTASYDRITTWVKRETAKIERLPLVNVDPELVAWSAEVTKRMREAMMSLATDRLSAASSVVAVQDPNAPTYGGNTTVVAGRGYYGSGYYYSYDGTYSRQAAQNAVDQENVARQRMQIIKQQQAQSLQTVTKIMGDLGANRNALRAKMTDKYKIEF
jgi:hypothetical protein